MILIRHHRQPCYGRRVTFPLRVDHGERIQHAMRRPTRTRRLLIAAIVSLLAFGAVAVMDVRSFWVAEIWQDRHARSVALYDGRVTYRHALAKLSVFQSGRWSIKASLITHSRHIVADAIWGFQAHTDSFPSPVNSSKVDTFFFAAVPLWFPLLLLLIIPICWLIARPANAPAFPVVT
jgi:hypothetical protein